MTRSRTDQAAERVLRRIRREMLGEVEDNISRIDEIYARVAEDLSRELRGVTSGSTIERIARERLAEALIEVMPAIEASVLLGATAGVATTTAQFNAIFPRATAPRVATELEAQAAAARVMRGELRARVVPLARRVGQNHRELARGMSREIQASLRAGESAFETMERVQALNTGGEGARVADYVERLRDAARASAELGGDALEREIRAVRSYVNRLGSVDRGNTSIRAATEELITRLRAGVEQASEEAIDRAVNRWALDKAQYQAKVIARTEAVAAHREAYERQMRSRPWTKGFKWNLSASHPRPDICFPAGTMIETARGRVPIESVRTGDLAVTHMGRVRPVVALSRTTGDQALVSLRCQVGANRDLQVEATHNHPFATDRGWVAAVDLRVGDRILVLREEVDCQHPCDTASTGQSGSPQSEPSAHHGTPCVEQCVEHHTHPSRTGTSASAQDTSEISQPGSDSDHSLSNHLTSSDYLHPCASRTACDDALHAVTTCQGGACRSSDCPCHDSPPPCTSLSSSAGPSQSAGTQQGTHHTLLAFVSTKLDSSRCCRTCSPYATSDASLAIRIECNGQAVHSEDRPRSSDCTSCGELSFDHPQSPSQTEALASCSIHMASGSWFEYATLNAIGHETSANEVFNIEVAEDHTYVANGMMVHNCDILANQNLHGLGPGGYESDAVPATPHPSCLCSQTAIIDEHYFDREIAALEGTTPPPETWDVGGEQNAAGWLSEQPAAFQRQILGPTRHGVFQEQPSRVLRPDGSIRLVRDVLPQRSRNAG